MAFHSPAEPTNQQEKTENEKKKFVNTENVYDGNVKDLTEDATIQFTVFNYKSEHEINSIDLSPLMKVLDPILSLQMKMLLS